MAARVPALLRSGLARRAHRHQAARYRVARVPQSYFKGLNFLLNEQPDKAIEAFIEVVKVDPETVELHFALGSLFRRRGETERAIRMHQNLLDRSDLAAEQRVQALFELGQDYLKAGLLDRAEEVFARLRDGPQRLEALQRLLEIYEQEKDWQRAIETARALEQETGQSRQKEIAEFHCELAAVEATHSRPDAARQHLDAALQANRRCVRASMLLGDLAAAAGRHDEAIEHWKRVETQNPAFLALVAQRLLKSFQAIGDTATGLTLLRGYLAHYPSLDLLDVVFQPTLDAKGPEPLTRSCATSCGATRRCSASTACSRRSSSRRPPSDATISSWCATSSTGIRGASPATTARTAAFARASSTGSARRAAAGRPTRRGGPRSSTLRHNVRLSLLTREGVSK